ncbi:MAG: bifunctional riboflavin kinase/FAD synthetase [Proteobacteria bacterium]|uniref:bifunctional riboflavin kinase/FAD synthetase n=1 Tax=Rudaea sp. TaxID=2136325 RepID=UPI001D37C840|nr:bifunctional riboflavin kinase/FAD synthetase [Pseudomonadota bacterium]MBS0565817.1 bifunctional riboflavin kinase/FAD synthetase [Pseudomonadota bacterium]
MRMLFRDIAGEPVATRGSVVCIGAFDGVHLGHRAVLARVRERARALSLDAVVASFEPLPREFFAHGRPVARLSNVREKIEQFRAARIDRALLLRFNAALAAMSAQEFVERVLVRRLDAREVWVGEGFRFGHARGGDVDLLQRLGREHGFTARALEPVVIDGERISSSAIREALAGGSFALAARWLGRPFAIGGHVVRGQQLGRKLGYPTANLRLGSRTSPVDGIFAVKVHGIGDAAHPGVASLGVRPTVNGKEPLLEAHLFDFDGDLYGRRIQVEFVEKLRDEEKFTDLDAMVKQIDRDALRAREILGIS